MKSLNSIIHVFGFVMMSVIFLSATQIAEAQMKSDIMQYVLEGNSKELSSALANGADVNQQTNQGNTPLMLAAKIGDRPTVDLLLSYKADVNMRNDAGATALMIAAKYNNSHTVIELLNHGADPTIRNNEGYKASNFAWGYKHYGLYDQLKLAENNFIAQK